MYSFEWMQAQPSSHAQTGGPPAAIQISPVGQILEKRLAGVEKELLGIASAMPGEKYSFLPSAGEFRGVRNFGKQLKHAAAFHYIVAAAILNEPPPADAADERGPDSVRTKIEIVRYLTDSFAYLRKAIVSIDAGNSTEPVKTPFGKNPETRLGLVIAALAHTSNHYGQVVEYLRMNGIAP